MSADSHLAALGAGEPVIIKPAGVSEPPRPDPDATRRAREQVLTLAHTTAADAFEKVRRLEQELGRERLTPLPAELLAMLRQLEWEGSRTAAICPACRRWRSQGHDTTCELNKLLLAAGGE